MNKQDIIELEMRLFILKYGFEKTVETIAKVRGLKSEEIEIKIHSFETKTSTNRNQKENKIDAKTIIASIISQKPEISTQLTALASKWDNKSFLPQMKDVRKFLERRGVIDLKVNSRDAALKTVFEFLATLGSKSLEELLQETNSDPSDLSIISDHILKHDKK